VYRHPESFEGPDVTPEIVQIRYSCKGVTETCIYGAPSIS